MQLDVYDTHARLDQGTRLHFDVIVPQGKGDSVRRYAMSWLEQIGIAPTELTLEHCRYCHSEVASPEIERQLARDGFFIVPMEGCPNPIF